VAEGDLGEPLTEYRHRNHQNRNATPVWRAVHADKQHSDLDASNVVTDERRITNPLDQDSYLLAIALHIVFVPLRLKPFPSL